MYTLEGIRACMFIISLRIYPVIIKSKNKICAHQPTLGILIKALPPIRALPGKNANIFIRALPLIRALPGKSQSLTVKIFYRQF